LKWFIAELDQHQPINRPAALSDIISNKRPGYSHPGYDHLHVALNQRRTLGRPALKCAGEALLGLAALPSLDRAGGDRDCSG